MFNHRFHPRLCRSWSLTLIFALVISAFAIDARAQDSETAVEARPSETTAAQPAVRGQVVDGPRNLRDFSPEETGTLTVAADKIDLRKVFEDLGPDATLWYQHVQTLANPFFEGRGPGTRGMEIAAEYIEFYFKLYGLEPAITATVEQPGGKEAVTTSYRQPFDFASPSPKVNVVASGMAIGDDLLQADKDFTVLGVSGSGMLMAPLTFAGYGIEKGEGEYSSFDNETDLKGRIAIVMRYEPLDEDGRSRWSETRYSRFASIAPKFKALADRGAAGILMVNPPGAADGKTGLESLRDSSRFGSRIKVPVFQITPETADRLLAKADPEGRDLRTWRGLADNATVKCVSLRDDVMVMLNASLDVDDRIETENVAGILRGKGSLADQWIVIGAHHDHLGYGYTGTRSPTSAGKVHPGADDNASGTAGVMIAAKRMVRNYEEAGPEANLRSVMFVTFSAEEAGLHGSKAFVKSCPMPTESIDLMINMDMIGRLRSDNLLVQGLGTAEGMEELLRGPFESSGLTISKTPGGRGPSDHASFFAANVPVLFFFTGEHREYHQPSDRAYTVNPAGAIKVVDLLESVTMELAARPDRLKFVRNTQGSTTGGPGQNRVRFGVMPDYAAELETGVRVEAVSEGTSAADAGIKDADVLLTWNGEEITGGQKLMEFISKCAPGDKVKITLLRDDKEMTVDVTMKARGEAE